VNPVRVAHRLPNDLAAIVSAWQERYADAIDADAPNTVQRLTAQARVLLADVADALTAEAPGIYIARTDLEMLLGRPLSEQDLDHLAQVAIPNAVATAEPLEDDPR